MLQSQPRTYRERGAQATRGLPAVLRLAPMPKAHLYKIDHYSAL